MRRIPVVAALTVASTAMVVALASSPALAYPPGSGSGDAALNSSSVAQGGTDTAQGGGFTAGEQVDGYIHSARVFVGATTANNAGVATLTFTVPNSIPPGHHTLELIGETSGQIDTAALTITAASSGNPKSSNGGLPFTGGSDIWQLTAAGVGLVLLGSALLVIRRRRHSGLAA